MRKKQRIIYSSITCMLLCAFVLMTIIMVKNSRTVSALNLSDAMQMDTYNKLHEIQGADVESIADWLYVQALDTLEANGVSLTSVNKERLREIIETKVLALDSQGLIQYENDTLTSLAKGYLANITTEAVAEVEPDALEVAASGYTQVYDYSALQEQVTANRDSITKLSQELQNLDGTLNGDDVTNSYTTIEELEQMYNSLQTIIMSASYASDDLLKSDSDKESATSPSDSNTSNILQSAGNLPDEEYTKIVNNIVSAVDEVKTVQSKLLSGYSDKVSTLETQLKAMSNVDSSLSTELNTIKSTLSAASGSVSEVASTIDILSSKLLSEISSTNSDVSTLSSSLTKLKDTVSKDNSDTASRISEVIDQINAVAKDGDTKSDNLTAMYGELYTLINDLDATAFKDKEELYSELTASITDLSNLTTSERVAMYEELTQSIAGLSDLSESERSAMYEELTASIATVATTDADERLELYNELSASISDLENLTNEEREALETRLTASITDLSRVSEDERTRLYNELSASISDLDTLSAAARQELHDQLSASINDLDSSSAAARDELYTQVSQDIEDASAIEAELRGNADDVLSGRLDVTENDIDVLKQFSSDTVTELEDINGSIDNISTQLAEAVADLEDANSELSEAYGTTLVGVTGDLVDYMESMQTEIEGSTDDIITDVNSLWSSLSDYADGLAKFNQDVVVTTGWTLTPTTSTAGTITINLSAYGMTYAQLSNVDVSFDASAAPMSVSVSGSGTTLTLSIKPTESRFNSKSVKVNSIKLSALGTVNVLQDATPSSAGVTFDEYSGSTGEITSGTSNAAVNYTAEEGVVHQ